MTEFEEKIRQLFLAIREAPLDETTVSWLATAERNVLIVFAECQREQNKKLNEFRQDDLEVILDEIERGVYKTQHDILFEVIRLFDEKFEVVFS